MDSKIIDRVTTQVNHIHSITFSGGEPSLNGAAIEHSRWDSFFFNCSFEYFWLTINARMFKENFYTALWELYSIAGDPEACVLTISGDQYHGIRSNRAMMKYQDPPFFSYEKMDDIWQTTGRLCLPANSQKSSEFLLAICCRSVQGLEKQA